MPRVPLDFLTKPIGYTFPIVTAALDELKPPAEIRKIRLAAQRGPLLVTLAAQLAAIVADAIYQQLAKPEVRHPFPELLALHGGKSYMALLQKVETASDHLNDAHRRVNQLEIRLVFHDWAVFESQRWATGKRTPSPLSGVLTWNPQPGDKGASTAKREYEKTTWDYLACRKKHLDLLDEVAEAQKQIQNLPPYVQELEKMGKRPGMSYLFRAKKKSARHSIKFHISESTPLMEDGIGHYLRSTDPGWWRSFTEKVEHKASLDYAGVPHFLMMRDPTLSMAMDILLSPGTNYTLETATVKVLEKPEKYSPRLAWRCKKLTGAAIRRTRTALARQDELAIDWITSRAGDRHPLDPYRRLRVRAAKGAKQQARFAFEKHYDFCRAENELLWCVSQKKPASFPFRGIFTTDEEKASWDQRFRKWNPKKPGYYAYSSAADVI